MFSFAIDYTAAAILSGALVILGVLKMIGISSHPFPYFKFSQLNRFKDHSWKMRFLFLPTKLHYIAVGSLMLAFIDPHLRFPRSPDAFVPPTTIPTEGIGIYLVLDQSGSMIEPIVTTENGQRETLSKIDFLKQVTEQFIQKHSSDLMGIVSFARTSHVLAPLTLDQETLLSTLQSLQVVENPDEDGTAMGYAIFKTAHLIAATRHFAQELRQEGKPAYDMKNAIIVVVTDGLQNPSVLDRGNRLRTIELDEAAAYTKEENIRLYVVNIDSRLSGADFAPQRRQLQAVTTSTGGDFYLVSQSQNLSSIYQAIDQLEKGELPQPILNSSDPKASYERFSFYPIFLIISLLCLLGALFFESFILKASP